MEKQETRRRVGPLQAVAVGPVQAVALTPSGRFFANAAWLLVSALAHNLARWIARLGLQASGPIVVQTIRRRYLTLPGRITRSARRATLHLPTRWPWREGFRQALARLRAIPLLT